MKAMVLAAGVGQRLRPLTVYWAKPALPVVGRPLIHYTLDLLHRSGVDEVVVNVHHKPETISAAAARASLDSMVLCYSEEPVILGTAGGLKRAAPLLGRDTFLLLNGDTLIEVDLEAMVSFHKKKRGKATLLLRPREDGADYTPVQMDRRGRIRSLKEGSATGTPLMFAGVWVLEPEVLDLIRADGFSRLEVDVLPQLIKDGVALGYVQDVEWFDLGTPRRYLSACLDVVERGLWRDLWLARRLSTASGSRPEEAVVVAGDGVTVEPEASFTGPVVLGSRVTVARGATVQRSVLWDDVVVGEDALVRNSIVAQGVKLAPKSRTVGKVVVKLGDERAQFRDREIVAGHVVSPLWSPDAGPPWI